MPITLLAPALLSAAVPEFERQGVAVPNLAALAAAGAIRRTAEPVETWLGALLGLAAEGEGPPPVAAWRLTSEATAAGERDGSYWLCADPIATTLGMDAVRIDRVVTDLTMEQAQALTASLTAFFAQDGLHFVAGSPARWYVRCAAPQRMATVPLWRTIGGSMLPQLATGDDAPAWRARLNEAQMLLHAHPVNAAREPAGLPAVASLWWWGGGAWAAPGPAAVDTVAGGPRWVAAACAAAGVDFQPLVGAPETLLRTGARRTLLVLDDDWESAAQTLEALERWDAAWFGPLRAALDAGSLDRAELVFPWGEGTLHIEVAPVRRPAWKRWFGAGRADAAPALAATLQKWA